MKLKALAIAAALTGFSVPAAQAVTVTFGATDETATMDVATNLGNPAGVSFTWDQSPAGGWIEFTTDSAWALQLRFYGVGDATPAALHVSGYILKAYNAVTNMWDNLTNDTNLCSTATLGPITGNCNLMGSLIYPGPEAALQPGERTGPYAAGRYLLGAYDSRQPSNTSAEFYIADLAPVPLPASGLALFAGLAGLAAIGARRRRTAA